MAHRYQRNITVSPEQKKFIEENYNKMSIGQLSKMLGLTPNKTYNNMKIIFNMPTKGKVVPMEGYFDVDAFGKLYNY